MVRVRDRVVRRCAAGRGVLSACACGCGQKVKRRWARGHNAKRHGRVGTRAYASWQGAKRRTSNPRDPKWPTYGARGITMCQRYRDDFAAFLADMGERPEDRTLDRIDNDGGYSCGRCAECIAKDWPANLRWATASEQAFNRRARVKATPAPCSEDACERPHYAKGVCFMHYMRAYHRRTRATAKAAR